MLLAPPAFCGLKKTGRVYHNKAVKVCTMRGARGQHMNYWIKGGYA